MNGNLVETLIGAVVLVVAAAFLWFAATRANVGSVDGYSLIASFDKVDGISVGSDDGVKVGMTFIIHAQAGDYLGDLEITDVEPNSSAGVLKFVTSKVSIGDLAVDERAYLGPN